MHIGTLCNGLQPTTVAITLSDVFSAEGVMCVCFSLPRSQLVCGLAGLMCDVLCLELLGMMLEIPSG